MDPAGALVELTSLIRRYTLKLIMGTHADLYVGNLSAMDRILGWRYTLKLIMGTRMTLWIR